MHRVTEGCLSECPGGPVLSHARDEACMVVRVSGLVVGEGEVVGNGLGGSLLTWGLDFQTSEDHMEMSHPS